MASSILLSVVSATSVVFAQDVRSGASPTSASGTPSAQTVTPATNQIPTKDPAEHAIPGMVVVELFTSEGCSSCPPADELLARIPDLFPEDRSRILCLAYHVDVWDKIGWADPYAIPENNRRHRGYNRLLAPNEHKDDPKIKPPGTYTPAMIVNGRTMFVGSDEELAKSAIQESLKLEPTIEVSIQPTGQGPTFDFVRTDVVITSLPGKALPDRVAVLCALVEDGLTSQVTAGENEGKTLKHSGVVRAFNMIRPTLKPVVPGQPASNTEAAATRNGEMHTPPAEALAAAEFPSLTGHMTFDLKLPTVDDTHPAVNLERCSWVVLAVDESNWYTLGAARIAFKPAVDSKATK